MLKENISLLQYKGYFKFSSVSHMLLRSDYRLVINDYKSK